jgi:hypothetical protein
MLSIWVHKENIKSAKGPYCTVSYFFSLTAQLPNQVVCGHQDVSGDEQTNLGAAQTKKLASYIFLSDNKKKEEADSTFVLSAIRIHC